MAFRSANVGSTLYTSHGECAHRAQSSCLQRTNTPIILSHFVIGCLGGTPTTCLAGHLMQIRASLPGSFEPEPFIFNLLIH